MEDLMRIKGIGHYTAAAVRNFAFNIPTPALTDVFPNSVGWVLITIILTSMQI